MNIPKDPAMLLSFINTQLRDFYPSVEELCSALSLSKEELDTNWDQGNVRVDELLSLAKDCLAGRKVLAVDLCGEPSANAPEAECSAASLVNQKLYGALAAKIED